MVVDVVNDGDGDGKEVIGDVDWTCLVLVSQQRARQQLGWSLVSGQIFDSDANISILVCGEISYSSMNQNVRCRAICYQRYSL